MGKRINEVCISFLLFFLTIFPSGIVQTAAPKDPNCGTVRIVNTHVYFIQNAMEIWPKERFEKAYRAATFRFGTDQIGVINILGIKIPTTWGNSDAMMLNLALTQLQSYRREFFYGPHLNESLSKEADQNSINLLPVWSDMSGGDRSIIKDKLQKFKKEFQSIQGCVGFEEIDER